MPYPNKVQWAVIWVAALLLFTRADYRFFPALGGYDGDTGRWLWPGVSRFDPAYNGDRIALAIIVAALLLLWQFSRKVPILSPILIPAAFLLLCVGWSLAGAAAHARASAAWDDISPTPPPPGLPKP